MKLLAIVDDINEVPEAFRACYVEFDDNGTKKWQLQVSGIETHPGTQALKNALDRQKQKVTTLTSEKAALEERVADLPEDFDPDLYQRAVTEGVGGGKIKNEDEIRREAAEAAKARAETGFATERNNLTASRDGYRNQLVDRIQRDELRDALDEAGVEDPALRKGAMALLRGSLTVHEDDGEIVVLANDPNLGDIPVADHVKAWADTDEGKVYVGARDTAGGGANGSPGGGKPTTTANNPWAKDTFNVTEQARLRREDIDKARRLAREAGVNVNF